MATSSTEATPRQGSEQPSLMMAGFKHLLLCNIFSALYTLECLLCKQFMNWHFGKYLYQGTTKSRITTSICTGFQNFSCFFSEVNAGEACIRMCFPWIIVYFLAHKIPPPKSLKKITWIFLVAIFIDALITVIVAFVDLAESSWPDIDLPLFYYVKTAFWGITTILIIPFGMIVLQCVSKKQRSALGGYDEV